MTPPTTTPIAPTTPAPTLSTSCGDEASVVAQLEACGYTDGGGGAPSGYPTEGLDGPCPGLDSVGVLTSTFPACGPEDPAGGQKACMDAKGACLDGGEVQNFDKCADTLDQVFNGLNMGLNCYSTLGDKAYMCDVPTGLLIDAMCTEEGTAIYENRRLLSTSKRTRNLQGRKLQDQDCDEQVSRLVSDCVTRFGSNVCLATIADACEKEPGVAPSFPTRPPNPASTLSLSTLAAAITGAVVAFLSL